MIFSQVRAFLQPPMEGVVIQTYGQGNGPSSRKDIMTALKEACDRGVVIVNITQCSRGVVAPLYAVGKALQDIGVLPGADMTVEAALMKLSYVLGKSDWPLHEKRQVGTFVMYPLNTAHPGNKSEMPSLLRLCCHFLIFLHSLWTPLYR